MQDVSEKFSKPLVIKALLDNSQPFPPQYLHFFSDISTNDLKDIEDVWEMITINRKINLLADLETLLESDTLLAFDDLAKFALTDNDPNVRSRAISLLWESDDPRVAEKYLFILENDPSEAVRSAVASALGRFVLLAELDELSPQLSDQIIRLLLRTFESNPPKEIQQEILKSLAYTNLPEVAKMISKAFESPDATWQLAALISMGRSADDRWEDSILSMLSNKSLPHQIEAVKAVGELEIGDAKQKLMDMLKSPDCDEELRFQIIWSLSKIGGDDVKELLVNLLEDSDSEDEIDIIEMALDNLEFSDGLPSLDIF